MNKLITLCAALLMTASLWAQAPQKISYQAVIRNNSGTLVTNTQIGMEINIRKSDPSSGTIVYTETQTPTTNANGLVSIEIGEEVGFSSINWASGTYYIETNTAIVAPLTTYTIKGVSQLLSVPYALHSKTAESISGTILETDPTYTKSQAANITETHITNLNNLSGTNTGDQDLSGLATTTSVTTGLNGKVDKVTGKGLQTNGTAAGEMQYWNGSTWIIVTTTTNEGATLQMIGGVPTWTGGTPPPPSVTNPTTGKVWMDRNLGATQVATSSTDAASYGDLYQWGRGADGHQIRTSETTTTSSTTDNPGHGNFVTFQDTPYDWRSPQNDDLWQGVNGVNNPCPKGYRLPTTVELDEERATWSLPNSEGAFASPLKLPMAGGRGSNGSLGNLGTYGYYWSSTVIGTRSLSLIFNSSVAINSHSWRTDGNSVRCIKD